MAEMVKTPAPLPPSFPAAQSLSAWTPLREPLFRAMWIAAIIHPAPTACIHVPI